jgi:type IV secretory pathway VirB10-like protein
MRASTRIQKLRVLSLVLPVVAAFALAACGGEPPPPAVTPEPEPKAAPAPEPTAAPEAPTPAPTATANAGPAPQPEQSVEGPPVLMSNPKELQAVFTTRPGAKLELGDDTERAVFRIREGSLPSAYIISFKVDPKGKSTGVPIGKTYRMVVQIENSSELPKVETQDRPFELTMPAGSKKDANLAIGEVTTDDKGREKIVWTVVAPEKIDDAMGTALFKIKAIGNYWLHVTAKPPTEPAK